MHISSVMVVALTSSVPRKMAGKPMELLTWLGKSDRPVATTFIPASLASQGQISGIGLAQKKPMAFLFIFFSHSGLIVSGPDFDNEIQTSAPTRASAIPP